MGEFNMCKTCQMQEGDSSSKRGSSQARLSLPEDRKKGYKGEHKGLPWKQAIQQAAMLEDQERDMLLMGWPWKMAIKMDDAIKKDQEKVDTVTSSEISSKTVEAEAEEEKK